MQLLNETLRQITGPDTTARQAARERLEQLTMPHWALGRLMDLAEDLAGITGSIRPAVERRAIVVMAGDHGVAEAGVSQYPREVTVQMVANFVCGGAGINALARAGRARVVVVDMGIASALPPEIAAAVIDERIAPGTANIASGPAMSREDAVRSIEAGLRVAYRLAPDSDILGVGEMGIGNTTPSSAIVATLCGCGAEEVTGRGSGIDDARWRAKVAIVAKALEVNRPDPSDGLDILARVGGFEIGGIAGLILGFAALRKPVLVDGFITTAAALIAQSLAPDSTDCMIAAHSSVEPGHRVALEKLNKRPLLDLGLRLGEGTGAALAMNLVEASARLLTDVATFSEASVSQA
jgi:nicotinate-nucleotide--dimethylbenzimidazole phosphoribosyltransferase